jgi:hypothetical protein
MILPSGLHQLPTRCRRYCLPGLPGDYPVKGGGIIRSASCGTTWARRNTMAAARTTANVNVMRSMPSSS